MTHVDFAAAARSHGLPARTVEVPFVSPPGIEDAFLLDRGGVAMHVGLHIDSGPGGVVGKVYLFAPLLVDIEDRPERHGLRFETKAGTATVGRFAGLTLELRPARMLQAAIVLEIEATDSLERGRWDLLLDAVDRASMRVADEAHRLAPRVHARLGGQLLIGAGTDSTAASCTSAGVSGGSSAPAETPSSRVRELSARPGRRPHRTDPPNRADSSPGRATSRLRRQRYVATLLWLPYSVLLVLGIIEHVFGGDEEARGRTVDVVDGQLHVSATDTVSTTVVLVLALWLLMTAAIAWTRTDRHEVGARSFGENLVLYLARPGRIVVVALVDLLIVMLPRLALALGLAAGLSLLLVAESLPQSYNWGNQHARGTRWKPPKLGYVAAALLLLVTVSMVVATEAVGLGTPVWGPPLAAWEAVALQPPSRLVGLLIGLALIALPLCREMHLVRERVSSRRGELEG